MTSEPATITATYRDEGDAMRDWNGRLVRHDPSIEVEVSFMHGHQSDALAALERATADVRRQIEETETRGAMESLAEDVSNAPPDQIIDTRPPGDYADSTPSMTVHLPAGMTSPSILRLVADEVRREPLGWGGKPKSLPRTLDELADAMDDARKRAVGNP